jgi:hypothetical protein
MARTDAIPWGVTTPALLFKSGTGLQRISRKGTTLEFPPVGQLRREARLAAYANTVLGTALGTTTSGGWWTLGLSGLLNGGIQPHKERVQGDVSRC